MQYSLFIMVAMDDFGNAQPVAFCSTEKDDVETLSRMLQLAGFLAAVRAYRPEWWPSCFLVDDDAASTMLSGAPIAPHLCFRQEACLSYLPQGKGHCEGSRD